jgi:hypothetical protein
VHPFAVTTPEQVQGVGKLRTMIEIEPTVDA